MILHVQGLSLVSSSDSEVVLALVKDEAPVEVEVVEDHVTWWKSSMTKCHLHFIPTIHSNQTKTMSWI